MDLSIEQIRAMQREAMGLPYEPRLQRNDGTVIVEFFFKPGGKPWKILAITSDGQPLPNVHI